jgi:hypothetical protein
MKADIPKIAEERVFSLMHEIEVVNNVTRMKIIDDCRDLMYVINYWC